jgi:hypothetical protein
MQEELPLIPKVFSTKKAAFLDTAKAVTLPDSPYHFS